MPAAHPNAYELPSAVSTSQRGEPFVQCVPTLWSKPRCVSLTPSMGDTAAIADAPGGNVTISETASVSAWRDGASSADDHDAVILIGASPGLCDEGTTVQPLPRDGCVDTMLSESARPASTRYFMAMSSAKGVDAHCRFVKGPNETVSSV